MNLGMRQALRLAAVCSAFAFATSCVVYNRTRKDEPVAPDLLAVLRPGQSLDDCMRSLGAPNQCFEYRGDGVAMLWAWSDTDALSVDVSLPLQDQVSASFDLDLADTEAQGCMLWFGPDLRLERWKQGRLGDLLPGRTRPSYEPPKGG
jgi:hypothetical protein